MHRRVILTNDDFGDTHHGNARLDNESYWVITVGATTWYESTWNNAGWSVTTWGEWEL